MQASASFDYIQTEQKYKVHDASYALSTFPFSFSLSCGHFPYIVITFLHTIASEFGRGIARP
jgi:hypothetical protein